MIFFFKPKKSMVWIKFHIPFKCQTEGATCQCGEVRYTSRNIKEKYYNRRAVYLDYWRPFTAFRSILEKCLSEEICLKLKTALK